MSLLPKYTIYSLLSSSHEQRRHTVDLFLDLLCSFSVRIWSTVIARKNLPKKYQSRIKFIFRHQIQAWHIQLVFIHTVVMVVAREQSSRLMDAISGLFKRERELFDEHVEEKSQIEIYETIFAILNEETQIQLDSNIFRTKQTEANAGMYRVLVHEE